ncbi:MAG: hypothetical protein H0V63_15170 [Burkholderiaceae bacterium]|nr:hypothetical protein [Burkholderiaceae bacterium]
MIETLLRDLRQAEYVHTLLNPLPVYGLALSLLGLIVALFLRSRPAQVTALVLILISAASAWPVIHFGEQAKSQVLTLVDGDGRAWLEEHEERAETLQYFFFALTAVTAAAIIMPKTWPRMALPLIVATIVLGVCSLGAGVSIAYAGGKIRHREFRTGPPPERADAQLR